MTDTLEKLAEVLEARKGSDPDSSYVDNKKSANVVLSEKKMC